MIVGVIYLVQPLRNTDLIAIMIIKYILSSVQRENKLICKQSYKSAASADNIILAFYVFDILKTIFKGAIKLVILGIDKIKHMRYNVSWYSNSKVTIFYIVSVFLHINIGENMYCY